MISKTPRRGWDEKVDVKMKARGYGEGAISVVNIGDEINIPKSLTTALFHVLYPSTHLF